MKAATKPASSTSVTMPESSQSGSLNPGRPVVRLRMKPTNMQAETTAPSVQADPSDLIQRRAATSSAATPPAMKRAPM
jgi:hypothetical protein